MGVFVAALLACQRAGAQSSGTTTLRVHPETTFQKMVGFGAGFYGGSLQNINAIRDREERGRVYDLLYGNQGARLNIVRLTISPNAEVIHERPARGLKAAPLRYNWAGDDHTQSAWEAIQPVLKRTKPIIYAVPFTPPAAWKDTGKLIKGGVLKREHYQDYAEYLTGFLVYYHKVLGVDIDVLSLQNEPGIAAPWESCIWTGLELRDFLKMLAPMVRGRGLNTQFMLSEGTSWTGAWDHLLPTLQDPEARRFLNVMASHSYGLPEDKAPGQFAAASARNGLPVWMSEMSLMFPPAPDDPGTKAAMDTALYLHRDLVKAHASAWIYCFAIYTAKFPGSMGVLSPADGDGPRQGALVVPKRFWAMANYSRFVRPGWKLMRVDSGGIAGTGFINPTGDGFVIVALNPAAKPQSVTYDFGDRTIGRIEAVATSKDLDLAHVPPPAMQSHGFSATLLPMSVTTFAGHLGP